MWTPSLDKKVREDLLRGFGASPDETRELLNEVERLQDLIEVFENEEEDSDMELEKLKEENERLQALVTEYERDYSKAVDPTWPKSKEQAEREKDE